MFHPMTNGEILELRKALWRGERLSRAQIESLTRHALLGAAAHVQYTGYDYRTPRVPPPWLERAYDLVLAPLDDEGIPIPSPLPSVLER